MAGRAHRVSELELAAHLNPFRFASSLNLVIDVARFDCTVVARKTGLLPNQRHCEKIYDDCPYLFPPMKCFDPRAWTGTDAHLRALLLRAHRTYGARRGDRKANEELRFGGLKETGWV